MIKKTKEELYADLMRKTEELDAKPTFKQVRDDPAMSDPNDYAYHFRSFSDAVDEVWRAYCFRKVEKEARAQAEKHDEHLTSGQSKKPVATWTSSSNRKHKKWQPSSKRVEEIRQFYLNYFIENETMPTFIEAEKGVRITRSEMSFMRTKFLLEKSYYAKEAAKITGKEYMDPWLEYNQNSILANQRRRELLEKQSNGAPIE